MFTFLNRDRGGVTAAFNLRIINKLHLEYGCLLFLGLAPSLLDIEFIVVYHLFDFIFLGVPECHMCVHDS